MARKRKSRKSPGLQLDPARQREMVGIILLAVGGLTLLSLLSPSQGALTASWIRLLRMGFGTGYILAPIGMALAGLWLILDSLDRRPDVGWGQPLGALLLFLVFLGLAHIFGGADDPRHLAAEGGGGGYLGLILSQALVDSLGRAGAVIVLLALAGIGLTLFLGRSTVEIGQAVAGAVGAVVRQVRRRVEMARLGRPPSPPGETLTERAAQRVEGLVRRPAPEPQAPRPAAPSPPATPQRLIPRVIGDTRSWQLPNIAEILEENIEQELSQAEIRHRVRVIEETLAQFGVPAKVVEVNQGPTVTQFGVEPGFIERRDRRGRIQKVKVKVSQISKLANDLALALAAAPIRVQAPVPGRGVVGIEVPNTEVHLVGLRGVMESDAFREIKGPLPIALGQDVSGEPVAADLAAMPHLLIAGATGSGKSVCINSILTCLLCTHTPETLKLVLIDPKRVELVNFNGIPHLAAPVVVDLERVMHVLRWLTGEMDRRFKVFARAGARNIEAYNRLMARGEPPLPYMILVVDELADLMMMGRDEVEQRICRLAQMARATGIHLILATQRPSVDVVTGLIKANFPARISFAVTSQVDSRVILDTAGAEKLLGRGDMLYMPPDSSKILRLQGCFVSDRELDRLVRYWKGMGPPVERPEDLVQQPLWEDLVAEVKAGRAKGQEEDDLWPEVMTLVRQHRSVSVSLLQRRLRIGYARAARLMDMLEERGIVGPAEGAKSRLVFLPEVDEFRDDDR